MGRLRLRRFRIVTSTATIESRRAPRARFSQRGRRTARQEASGCHLWPRMWPSPNIVFRDPGSSGGLPPPVPPPSPHSPSLVDRRKRMSRIPIVESAKATNVSLNKRNNCKIQPITYSRAISARCSYNGGWSSGREGDVSYASSHTYI